jgi:hypothetical protein
LEPEEVLAPGEPLDPVEAPEPDELLPALAASLSPASPSPPNVPPPHAAQTATATETRKNARISFIDATLLE